MTQMFKPAPDHNPLKAPASCMCVECSRFMLSRRCTVPPVRRLQGPSRGALATHQHRLHDGDRTSCRERQVTVNNSRRCSDGDEGVEGPVGAQAPGPPLPPISSTSAQVDAEDSLSPESPPAPGSLIHDRSHESDDVFHRAIAHLERTAQ